MIIAFHFPGLRQLPHDMVEPAMRLMAIGLGGFHHGIDHCTGIGAGGCIAKEPGAPTSDKGADRFLLSSKTIESVGAPGRGRTGTTVRSRDFKSLASTNFATGAELCLAATAASMLILPETNLLRRDQSVGVNDLCFSLQHVLRKPVEMMMTDAFHDIVEVAHGVGLTFSKAVEPFQIMLTQ